MITMVDNGTEARNPCTMMIPVIESLSDEHEGRAAVVFIYVWKTDDPPCVEGRQAALYSGLFTTGLFLTIAFIGVICALLGRMLGDVGPYWTIVVGLILLWVSMDMLGVATCSMGGNLMGRFKPRGGTAFRRLAGVLIGLMGIYFIVRPFLPI